MFEYMKRPEVFFFKSNYLLKKKFAAFAKFHCSMCHRAKIDKLTILRSCVIRLMLTE